MNRAYIAVILWSLVWASIGAWLLNLAITTFKP